MLIKTVKTARGKLEWLMTIISSWLEVCYWYDDTHQKLITIKF